jgi:hypothetical protein
VLEVTLAVGVPLAVTREVLFDLFLLANHNDVVLEAEAILLNACQPQGHTQLALLSSRRKRVFVAEKIKVTIVSYVTLKQLAGPQEAAKETLAARRFGKRHQAKRTRGHRHARLPWRKLFFFDVYFNDEEDNEYDTRIMTFSTYTLMMKKTTNMTHE